MISTNDSLTFFTLHFSIVISLRTSVCDAQLDLVREKCQKSRGGVLWTAVDLTQN